MHPHRRREVLHLRVAGDGARTRRRGATAPRTGSGNVWSGWSAPVRPATAASASTPRAPERWTTSASGATVPAIGRGDRVDGMVGRRDHDQVGVGDDRGRFAGGGTESPRPSPRPTARRARGRRRRPPASPPPRARRRRRHRHGPGRRARVGVRASGAARSAPRRLRRRRGPSGPGGRCPSVPGFRPRGSGPAQGSRNATGARRTPSQPSAGAGARAGSRSWSGASTKARSRHPGVRDGEDRVVRRVPVDPEDVDVERARPPPHVAHPGRRRFGRGARGQQVRRREVGLDRDDGVEEVVLHRPADRVGLVDRRHRRDPHARRRRRAGRPRAAGTPSRSPRLDPIPRYAASSRAHAVTRTPTWSSTAGTGGRSLRTVTVTAVTRSSSRHASRCGPRAVRAAGSARSRRSAP